MKTLIHTYTVTAIFLLITNLANAQLCQGSLGDPIVNITFGSGPNPGQPFSAATTTYVYTSADCPSDGYYAIRNSTSGCFGAWHSIAADHTGDPNGYFMLVNASYNPSAFYLDTVHGLCSNTTFEFAAWIANMLMAGQGCQPSIQPDLTFTIEKTDGTVLKTFNTGGIPEQSTFTWQQMGFYFTTPPGIQDVVLRIVNNASGGCGNDLALDDITFRPCGPTIMASIMGSSSTSLSFCTGSPQSVTFTGNVMSGLANPVMQWQQNINGGGWQDIPGATATTLLQNYVAAQTPGTYQYRLSAVAAGNLSICRTTSQVLSVTIMPTLTGAVSSNAPLCAGSTLLLSVTGSATYQWTGVNGFTATGTSVSIPNVQAAQSGKYYVQASAPGSCPYSDSITVNISPAPVATVSADTSICENESVQLTSSGGTTYQWLPSTGLSADNIANPVARPADTTSYMVIVSTSPTCRDTAYVVVNVGVRLTGAVSSNAPLCAGSTLLLSVTGSATYQWTGVNGFTATGTSVSIPNVQAAQSGKYYVQASAPGSCPYSDSITVNISPAPLATVSADTSICENESVQLTSSGGTTYQWLPSTGLSADNIANPVARPADTTRYMVIVSTSPTCRDTAYVIINVNSRITVNAGPDKSILKGETTTLNGTVNGTNITYNWTPTTYIMDATSLTPQVSPSADIDYILSTTSNSMCGNASDTVHVFVFPDIYIPNAFTPNKDGHNDTWHIPALKAIPVFELSVFNRWGQLIYHVKNNDISWNGQFNGIDQPTGGYAYMLNIGNGKRILKGVVMLLR